ncbi:MAG: hypothetical protein IJZ93_05080 [Clostridia bacterium]|nr:hypothetical protein [Clostridia bacterium]
MKILDTYDNINQCFTNEKFDIDKWTEYADGIISNLSKKLKNDIAGYDFEKEVLPVIYDFLKNKEKADLAHYIFLNITSDLSKNFIEIFNEDINVTVVLYLGLCNGAGWATEVNGEKTVLLGIEKILELSWYDKRSMLGLVYHEIGHIYHFLNRKITDNLKTEKERAFFQLYTEGVAMYIEQLLCKDMSFYHQDVDGWLVWCNINKTRLYKLFLERIENREGTQCFFGDWNSIEGKSDIGYYLGCELIKKLAEKYSFKEILNIDLQIIERALKNI